jgi:hypothetical protein
MIWWYYDDIIIPRNTTTFPLFGADTHTHYYYWEKKTENYINSENLKIKTTQKENQWPYSSTERESEKLEEERERIT